MKNKETYKVESVINDLGGRLTGALEGIGVSEWMHLLEDLPPMDRESNLLKDDGIICVEVKRYSELEEGKFYVIKLDIDRISIGKHLYVKNGLPYFQLGEFGEVHAMPYPLNMVLRIAAVWISNRDKVAA